jgi:hypothetical protein
MSDSGDSEQEKEGGKVLPIQANDPPLVVAAHTVWNRMIEDRSSSVKAAGERTGLPPWQFYKALKSDVIQAEVNCWLNSMRTGEAKFLKDNSFEIALSRTNVNVCRE